MKKISVLFSALVFYLLFAKLAFAHEAYVLTRNEFDHGLQVVTKNPLQGLLDPRYIQTSLLITVCIVALFTLSFLWATTPLAARLDRLIRKLWTIGPLIIRLAISTSFYFAASANSILGPELSLATLPYGQVVRYLLFLLAILIFFGFLTEVAAAVGLLLFFYVSYFYGSYMVTYANYFGELLVLLFFGSRFLSIDRLLFGKKAYISFFEKKRFLETPLVRILYGIALIYAGYTIKFVHQGLSIAVYNQYHLINFFHAPADFIAAGAGLSEITIGVFILFGFAQRITIAISLIFITLSLLYFQEMLWPHLMLYGISLSLFVNSSDPFTIDHYFIPFLQNIIKKLIKK